MPTDLAEMFMSFPESPFRVPAGGEGDPKQSNFDLSNLSTDSKGSESSGIKRDDAEAATAKNLKALSALQEVFYADGRRALLVVLQAIDAGGKDSTIRHIFGHLNPQGVQVWSFKVPTDLERSHDFMWRYHAKAPPRGMVGIFNRSHYESVLVERIKGIVSPTALQRRYGQINAWESTLVSEGTTILKFFLHLSPDEQAKRFRDRLTRQEKWWKFSAADLEERKRWPEYMEAFRDALAACSTPWAPWYAIPADQKWYRNHLISGIVRQTLEAMELEYPKPEKDMAAKVDGFLKALEKPITD